jgi:ribosome maturation factor RimP
MNIKELETKIKEIIGPLVNSIGMEIESVKLAKAGRKFLLKVFIEKDGGITVDDCARASREIEALLDVEDVIPYSYVLEVSSPGLDRPLRNPADFKRFSGKTARIVTSRPIENQTFFIGEIIEAGDDEVVVLLPKDKKTSIPYKDISRARLEVIFTP